MCMLDKTRLESSSNIKRTTRSAIEGGLELGLARYIHVRKMFFSASLGVMRP